MAKHSSKSHESVGIPEAELVRAEWTVRSLRLPPSVGMTRKSMVRWLALSLGLISPGESRTGMLDVLDALLHFQLAERTDPTVPDLLERARAQKAAINEKALRYHLLALKRAGLVEGARGCYFLARAPDGEERDLTATLRHSYGAAIGDALGRAENAAKMLTKAYRS